MTEQDRFSLLLYRTSLCGCLLAFVATFYFIFGLAGALRDSFPNLICGAAVFLGALFVLGSFFIGIRPPGRWPLLVWLSILVVLI